MQKKGEQVYEVDVLILGAGISGLSAAYALSKKKKLLFAVLEAQSRIGGRIWSEAITNGLVIEHGAEWIGVTHKHIRTICKKLNVTLETHTYLNSPYIENSEPVENQHMHDIFKKLENILSSKKNLFALEKISLLNFFQKHFSAQEVAILRTIFSAEFGDDPRNVSAFREAMDHSLGGKNTHMDFHVRGGNGKLIDALSREINEERIFTHHEVRSIVQGRDGVIVTCANGSVWRAKKVICTLPTQILARIHCSPALPKHIRSSALNLRYGNIVKVMLTFPKRFWRKEDFSFFCDGFAQYIFHATRGQAGREGVLCLYAVGKRADALQKMSMSRIWNELIKVLPREIDTKGIRPISRMVHSWAGDRFAQGAYAVYQPGEWARVQKAFGKPHKHMYFAGEHLGVMQGFMEGAVATGMSSAKQVINELV